MNYLTSTSTKFDVLGVKPQVIEVNKLKFHIYSKKNSLKRSNSFEQNCDKSVNNSCSALSPCRVSLEMGWFLAGVHCRGRYSKILQEMCAVRRSRRIGGVFENGGIHCQDRLQQKKKKCYRFLLIVGQRSLSFKQKWNKLMVYSEIDSFIIDKWHKMTYKNLIFLDFQAILQSFIEQ